MADSALPALPTLKVGGTSLKGAASGFLNAILAELIANKLGGMLQGAGSTAFEPQITGGGGAGSKYMITLPEARQTELAFANENFRRSLLGLPQLDVQEFIRAREENLRLSASQAGTREYAREQLKAESPVAQTISNMLGTQATATSNLASNVANQLLAQSLIDPAIAAAATGK